MGAGEGTGLKDKDGDNAGDGTLAGVLDEITACGEFAEENWWGAACKVPRLLLIDREPTDARLTRPAAGDPG